MQLAIFFYFLFVLVLASLPAACADAEQQQKGTGTMKYGCVLSKDDQATAAAARSSMHASAHARAASR